MRLDRRALLRSLAVVAGAGSAGCFGGDDDTPSPTGGPPGGSPPETPTATTTRPRTPTRTTLCGVCVDAPALLVPPETTPEATAGSTVTVPATLRNPYGFEVVDVEVALDPPSAAWRVAPDPITVEAVPAGERRDLEWEVSIPEDADAGEYTLTTVTLIQGPRIDHTIRTNGVGIRVTES